MTVFRKMFTFRILQGRCLYLTIITLSNLSFCQPYNTYHGLLSMHELDVIADSFEQSLLDFHRASTSIELLPNKDGRVESEDVNPEASLEMLSSRITDLFETKRKAVKRVVETLEAASENYTWEDELENNFTGVAFMNASTEEQFKNNGGVVDNLLGVNVNKSMSAIHVPLEVYEGYPEIVNGLSWSSVVDETFKENAKRDPTLAWQFFAAQTGFMRFYPSVTKWYVPPPYNPVDLYDARRRPWYIQGSASPKDIIIMMDRSGSVHGQTLTIMKFAIETLIDTLGEDDFVNVAAFDETTSWVTNIVHDDENPLPWECHESNATLLQATNINKKALVADIQHLTAKGIANYTDALDFAYRTFKNMSETSRDRGSNCHKLVMVFSDGGTEWPEDVLKKYLNDSDTSDVRLFTYAVGPHPIPTAVMKKMSCETGGQFTVITTSSGVRTKIQESYVGIVGEPLAASGSHVYHYTSLYSSAITKNLTISITLPVFNMSKGLKAGKSELLGVAGVDIPAQHIENFIPRETLGPLGYAFIINNNGILVMHPHIHPQESYLQDPPNLDLMDKELNDERLEAIRTQMINRDRGGSLFAGKLFLDDNRIIAAARLKYTFMPIPMTPYSLGLVTIPYSRHLKINTLMPVLNIDPRNSLLAPWNFCGVHPAFPKPDLVNKRLVENVTQCNQQLINTLMWAQEWTNKLVKKWEQDTYSSRGVISRAIFTRFGIARVVKGSEVSVNASILMSTPLGSEWRDPIKNPSLKRGVLQDGMALFPHPHGAFVSEPAYMNDVAAAVVGVNVTSEMLDKMVADAISPVMSSNSSFIVIVDESAFIVASSQYANSSGEFLGKRWPLLLEKLVEAGMYERRNVMDYEALCSTKYEEVGPHTISSAERQFSLALHPLKLIAAAFANLLSIFEILQCCMMSFFVSLSVPQGADAIYKAGNKEACIIEHTVYFLTEKNVFSGNISCLEDSAQVLVRRLNSTNAIVVAVEESLVNLSCDGWMEKDDVLEQSTTMLSKRTRRIDPKEVACRAPRYRRRPEECEVTQPVECSGGMKSAANSVVILAGLLIILSML